MQQKKHVNIFQGNVVIPPLQAAPIWVGKGGGYDNKVSAGIKSSRGNNL